jgi:hypothetical protein
MDWRMRHQVIQQFEQDEPERTRRYHRGDEVPKIVVLEAGRGDQKREIDKRE